VNAADRHLLSTADVAERLGVKAATVYSYVSRGLLTVVSTDDARHSRFDPSEVDSLARRARQGAPTQPVAVIETAITAVTDTMYFYRGVPAVGLVDTPFEEVAEFLWTGTLPDTTPRWQAPTESLQRAAAMVSQLGPDAIVVDQLRLVAAVAAVGDPFRLDLRPEAVKKEAGDLIALLIAALPDRSQTGDSSIAAALWSKLSDRSPTADELMAINGALVLLADHELAASTFAGRIAASFRADPAAVLGAALGPLSGALHGAVSLDVTAMLRTATEEGVGPEIARRLRQQGTIPGFGHPLYPNGDPRTPALLELVEPAASRPEVLAVAQDLATQLASRGLPPPNVDFGLAALTLSLGLRDDAGEAIFAIARSAGWLAHALEEYANRSDLRPRARYVGPPIQP
jgi:citrate synthase